MRHHRDLVDDRPRRPLPTRCFKVAALLAGALLAGAPASWAQAAPTTPPTPPQGAAAASPPELSAAGRQAFAAFEAGDYPAAIAALEAASVTSLAPVERALLGALHLEAGRPDQAWTILEPLARGTDADAAVLYNAGRAALALGKRREAIEMLQRSVAIVPVSPAARELGLLAGSTGRSAIAYGLLRPWALAHPEDLEARLGAAAAALRLERARDAELLLSGELPEDDPGVMLLRAQLALLSGRPDEAAERVAPLLASPPPEMDLDLRRLAADAYIQLGRASEAAPLVTACAVDDARCALLLSEARYRSGDLAGAVTALDTHAASALASENETGSSRPRLAQSYGRMLVAAGRYAEALPYLRLATELTPDDGLSWKTLGDALAALGQRVEATAALERFRAATEASQQERRDREAEKRDPAGAALREAAELLAAGEGSAALLQIRQEVALGPTDLRPRAAEVQTLLALGRLDDALVAAEKTVAAFPEVGDALYLRAITRIARQEPEAARADLQAVLALAPEHVPAMDDLALLLTVAGERDEARRLLQRVLELRPDHPVAAERLRALQNPAAP